MYDQLAREWICRPMSKEMSLITEKMVADAIKEDVSQRDAAVRWNVQSQALSKLKRNESGATTECGSKLV